MSSSPYYELPREKRFPANVHSMAAILVRGVGVAVISKLSEETYQKWKKLALDIWRAGGKPSDLVSFLGISEQDWDVFLDAVEEHSQPRVPTRDYPIVFPPTSPTSYVSFRRALNLKMPGERTGDRHFRDYFFGFPKGTVTPLAGSGGVVDTTPSLGSKGVRDMGKIIAEHEIQSYNGPVYVANHYRALADIAAHDLLMESVDNLNQAPLECILSPWTINDCLNNVEAELERLIEGYLRPLRSQLNGSRREAFERWLPTVACH